MALALLEFSSNKAPIINPNKDLREQLAVLASIHRNRIDVLPFQTDILNLTLGWDAFETDDYYLQMYENGRGLMKKRPNGRGMAAIESLRPDLLRAVTPGVQDVRMPEDAVTVPIIHARPFRTEIRFELGKLVVHLQGENPPTRIKARDYRS